MKKITKGASFALIAPSSCVDPALVDKGIEILHQRGYGTLLCPRLKQDFKGYGGCVAQRVEAVHWAFSHPEADAVLCVRGGYGAIQLLEHLNYELIRKNPKPFVGYSDIGSLHMAFIAKSGLQTVHGPMLSSDIAVKPKESTDLLLNFLEGQNNILAPAFQVLKKGYAEGILLGGNLAVFMSSLSTPYMPVLDGSVLFFEDVGEPIYKIDRMLRTLRHMGVFNLCTALVFGNFKGDGSESFPQDLIEVFEDVTQGLDIPVIYDLLSGHCTPNYPLSLGAKVSLDTEKQEFLLKEALFFN